MHIYNRDRPHYNKLEARFATFVIRKVTFASNKSFLRKQRLISLTLRILLGKHDIKINVVLRRAEKKLVQNLNKVWEVQCFSVLV